MRTPVCYCVDAMSARDDYPPPRGGHRIGFEQYHAMCDEIDRLRAAMAAMSETLCKTGRWLAQVNQADD